MRESIVDFVIVLVVLTLVVVFVSGPFRRSPEAAAAAASGAAGSTSEIAELEAARDAKYREIRDAEMDHRTGKLSDADYQEIDGALRAEAIEIMHALDNIGRR